MHFVSYIQQIHHNTLALRLLFSIIIFSSIITIVITTLQLYLIYNRDITVLYQRLEQIEESYTESIESSLWDLNNKQTQIQLNGIIRLPDINYAAILDTNEQIIIKSGQQSQTAVITKMIPLSYTNKRNRLTALGLLVVNASKTGVYNNLKLQLLVILSSQAIKTFLVSIFILSIFYYLVTKHISKISQYTQNIKKLQFNQTLELDRKNNKNEDDLDRIVKALNEMRELAQLLPEIIFEIDLKGKFLYVNQMAYQESGYNSDDFSNGLSIFDLLIPEHHQLVKDHLHSYYFYDPVLGSG